ncbi:18585_t:CDS:1, partial [Racocetra persica]
YCQGSPISSTESAGYNNSAGYENSDNSAGYNHSDNLGDDDTSFNADLAKEI